MKITPGRTTVPSGGNGGSGRVLSRSQMQKALARQAAIESDLARYMELDCGHFTTLEVQQLYSRWKPKRGMAMCEHHNDWVLIKRPREVQELPQTPLF